MENFAPDAPNIWAGIEQGVQANAAAQSAVVGKSLLVKSVITIAKIAAILVIPVSAIVYFVNDNNEKASVDTKTEAPVLKPEVIEVNKRIVDEKISESKELENSNKITNKEIISNTKTANQTEGGNEVMADFNSSKIIETNHKEVSSKIENNDKNISEVVANQIQEDEIIQKDEELIAEVESQKENVNEENAAGIKRIPNVFTPNNDGVNDKYVVELEGEKFYNLKIYNYDNELVFESNEKNHNWDGINFKTGQACNSGIYYGILIYKLSNEDKNLTRMTRIKLIR